MVRIPMNREPSHPGEVLSQEFLAPMGLTQAQLAEAIHVPDQYIRELVEAERGVTPSLALRLARYFGVSEGFWLNLQLRWDLFHARETEAETLAQIEPVTYP